MRSNFKACSRCALSLNHATTIDYAVDQGASKSGINLGSTGAERTRWPFASYVRVQWHRLWNLGSHSLVKSIGDWGWNGQEVPALFCSLAGLSRVRIRKWLQNPALFERMNARFHIRMRISTHGFEQPTKYLSWNWSLSQPNIYNAPTGIRNLRKQSVISRSRFM